MTLDDLRQLCHRYVPAASRHPALRLRKPERWWYAHELGHLLTVEPAGIGEPMFGIPQIVDDEHGPAADEARCLELAAMDVGRRLLIACRRPDLVETERRQTEDHIREHDDRGRVREILAAHRVQRLPGSRAGLEALLQRAVAAAQAVRA